MSEGVSGWEGGRQPQTLQQPEGPGPAAGIGSGPCLTPLVLPLL